MSLKTIVTIAVLLLIGGEAVAQPMVSPERGNPLRAEVLNAVRPTIEKETGGPVIFVVSVLNVKGGWAYAEVTPQRPGGASIDWRRTKFREAFEADAFSGLVLALLRKRDGAWILLDHFTGPTDVAWLEWVEKYKLPEALFRRPE
jgi:hypothetical protein